MLSCCSLLTKKINKNRTGQAKRPSGYSLKSSLLGTQSKCFYAHLTNLWPFTKVIFMTKLFEKNCIPCKGGIPPFDISEIHKYLKKIDGWDVKKNKDNIHFLEKNFKFKNFSESQKFVNEAGDIAEAQGHHPDVIFGWGYAKIKIFTHKIKGLVESDFILAAKIDKIKI